MIAVRSIALGLTTFVFEWVLASVVMIAFTISFDRLGLGDSHTLREALAVLLCTVVVLAAVVVVVGGAFRFAPLVRANPWLALAVAALLSGLTAYWLLKFVSLANDCTVEVSFPYPWVHPCSRGV